MMLNALQHDPVHVGKDGWLFLVKGSNSVINLYKKRSSFTAELAEQWVTLLQSRMQKLADKNIDYLFLPAPEKLTVMHQHYDGKINNIHGSPIHTMVNNHHARVPCIVNVLPAFSKLVETNRPYWKTDTHWSFWGCFAAYQVLCARMGIPSRPELLQAPFDEGDVLFDLGAKLTAPVRERARFYKLIQTAERVYANPMVRFKERNQLVNEAHLHVGSHVVYKNNSPHVAQKKVVLFGDSFSEYRPHLLTGMLAETVSELHFIWNARLDYEYISLIQPDIVINELAERFMVEVPKDNLCVQAFSNDRVEGYKKQRLEKEEMSSSAPALFKQTVLLPEEQYPLTPPETVQKYNENVVFDGDLNVNRVQMKEIERARLFFDGANCIVKTEEGHSIAQFGNRVNEILKPWTPCKKLSGTTLLLGYSQGAHCYYHWMLDILPKLGLLNKAGYKLEDIDHILVREVNDTFQKETLERLGVDLNKVIQTKEEPLYQCERLLHIVLDNGINMKMNRFIPSWLKQQIQPRPVSGERLKLYVTRPAGVRRGIENEEELLPILEKHGYTVRAMEGLNVVEQADLFSRADVIASPHGGALTNMVFANPGTTVVELFGRHVYPYYYGLAAVCGHRYHTIMTSPEEDFQRLVSYKVAQDFGHVSHQQKTRALPFSVCPDLLSKTLTSIG
jgi:alginate O-acetyltransferase complex protein AlgJ